MEGVYARKVQVLALASNHSNQRDELHYRSLLVIEEANL